MGGPQQKKEKADARAAALRDNLKKRKAFIKKSGDATVKNKNRNAIGGGTEEDALKETN